MLRDLEDYRCKVYDQLQSNCQDFEAENQQLIQRHQLATEQIKRLKMLSDEQELQEKSQNDRNGLTFHFSRSGTFCPWQIF